MPQLETFQQKNLINEQILSVASCQNSPQLRLANRPKSSKISSSIFSSSSQLNVMRRISTAATLRVRQKRINSVNIESGILGTATNFPSPLTTLNYVDETLEIFPMAINEPSIHNNGKNFLKLLFPKHYFLFFSFFDNKKCKILF